MSSELCACEERTIFGGDLRVSSGSTFQKCQTYYVISSEGALIAITPYDYPQQHPPFEHTPVLDNNLNINAMITLVTMITIKTAITKTKSAASVA